MISATELKHQAQAFMNDGVELIRKEVQLARAELNEKVNQVQSGIVSLAAGAAVGFVGLIFLGHAAASWLATIVSAPTAFLIVALILIAVAIIMLSVARSNLRAEELKPRRTINAAKNVASEIGGNNHA